MTHILGAVNDFATGSDFDSTSERALAFTFGSHKLLGFFLEGVDNEEELLALEFGDPIGSG